MARLATTDTTLFNVYDYIDSSVNGTPNYVPTARIVPMKIIKVESYNQRVNDQNSTFRFTVYISKRWNIKLQDQVEIQGKRRIATESMLNGKWVLQ